MQIHIKSNIYPLKLIYKQLILCLEIIKYPTSSDMSRINHEPFTQTACFFQPRIEKDQTNSPLILSNRQYQRRRSSSRKFSLDQLIKKNDTVINFSAQQSPRSHVEQNEASVPNNVEKHLHLLNMPIIRRYNSIDIAQTKRLKSQEPVFMDTYQQKRTNSAHLAQVQLKLHVGSTQNKNQFNKQKLHRAITITDTYDKLNPNMLHYDIYTNSKIRTCGKPLSKLFNYQPMEQGVKDLSLLKKQISQMKNIKLPTLISDQDKKKDLRFKTKTFLQSKAQMNMLNKLFKI